MDILFFFLPVALVTAEYFLSKSRKRRDDAAPCGDCI
jgi:hypothetical protein